MEKSKKDPFHPFGSLLPSLPPTPSHKGAASIPLHHKKDLPMGLGQKELNSDKH